MAARTLPSFLNYNRSISPSEGLLFGVAEGKEVPVEVIRRGIRGSISSYSNVYTGDKAQSSENVAKALDPKNANLQEIDAAYLTAAAERLLLRFSLVVQNNSLAPSGCNDAEYYALLRDAAAAYAAIGGYDELAARYVWNILNGRTLWRNRYVTDKAVRIVAGGDEWTFATDGVPLAKFDRDALPKEAEGLVALMSSALSGQRPTAFLKVDVSGATVGGAEVFPSQEFLPDSSPLKGKGKGKVLSTVPAQFEGRDIRHATMHSQKIGNAIRVIDDWHGQVEEFGVTAVEAFGYVQSRNGALRLPKGNAPDIFDVLKRIDAVKDSIKAAKSAAGLSSEVHYMMAMLVRGGVFSGGKAA